MWHHRHATTVTPVTREPGVEMTRGFLRGPSTCPQHVAPTAGGAAPAQAGEVRRWAVIPPARTALVAMTLAIGLIGTGSPPALAGRQATATYVGTTDSLRRYATSMDTTTGCGDMAAYVPERATGPRDDAGAGGACFWLEPGESHVRIRIIDATGLPVGATLFFGGGEAHSGWMGTGKRPRSVFCGRAVMTIPYDATYLVVEVGGDSIGQAISGPWAPHPLLPCAPGPGAVATSGTIVAFFR